MNKKDLLKRKGGIFPKGQITLEDIITTMKQDPNLSDAGTFTCFIGLTRRTSRNGKATEKLEIETFEEKANETLDIIAREIIQKKGIIDTRIYHATGTFDIGEELVFVVVAGSHRDEAFPALREAVERYKKEAAIWKKEYLATGEAYWTTE
ncbi:MAG: molybdenum cofactor biosynthesis protein MoaE [Candidatus Heimdallarchaeota archaeon]